MRKILFIAALHGNEQIPIKALSDNKFEFLLANPNAVARNLRFIDKDMNKSFGTDGNALEEKLAQNLLKTIKQSKPDYIIDFHTTSSTTDPFAIIVDPKLLPIAQTLGLKHIVYMKHNIKKGNALINHYPGVSVEAGIHNDPKTYDNTINIAKNALKQKEHAANLYEVFDVIDTPGKYINFKPHQDGFIPILAGEVAYDFYGLKARKVDSFS